MQPVYLNHLLIFPDADTYRSIGTSGFLNGYFATSEERTTHDQATGMSWTGRYYYGRHTYFEFMDPDRTSWAPRDGLAFGIESVGGSEKLVHRLERGVEKEVRRYKRNRRYRDEDVPWFWSVEVPRRDDARLISWVMEYDPGFLDRWGLDIPPDKLGAATAGISRSRFLTRYRSAIGDNLSDRLFRDITSVTVSLPPDEAVLFEAELEIYGYAREKTGHEARTEPNGPQDGEAEGKPNISREWTKFRGPDLDIVVERISPDDGRSESGNSGGPGGITAFTMETRPVSVTTVHTFGPSCRLTIESSGRATWSFSPNTGSRQSSTRPVNGNSPGPSG